MPFNKNTLPVIRLPDEDTVVDGVLYTKQSRLVPQDLDGDLAQKQAQRDAADADIQMLTAKKEQFKDQIVSSDLEVDTKPN